MPAVRLPQPPPPPKLSREGVGAREALVLGLWLLMEDEVGMKEVAGEDRRVALRLVRERPRLSMKVGMQAQWELRLVVAAVQPPGAQQLCRRRACHQLH